MPGLVEASSTSILGKRKGSNSQDDYNGPVRTGQKYDISYETRPEELIEDASFTLIGEDDSESPSPSDSEDVMGGLPCRMLSDWTIFDLSQNQRLVGFESISNFEGSVKTDVVAVGFVRPVISHSSRGLDDDECDNGNDDKDSDAVVNVVGKIEERSKTLPLQDQLLRLSSVLSWEITMRTDGGFEIWLRTEFAFYHLLEPADEILPFVSAVIRRLSLSAILIATIIEEPSMAVERFLLHLKSMTLTVQTDALKYRFNASGDPRSSLTSSSWIASFTCTLAYVEKEAQYLFAELQDCLQSGEEEFCAMVESPLWGWVSELAKGNEGSAVAGTALKSRSSVSYRKSGRKNVNDQVLLHENPTTVTKWIGRLAGGLFLRTLLVCDGGEAIRNSPNLDAALEIDGSAETMNALIDLTCDPKTARLDAYEGRIETECVAWNGVPVRISRSRIYYESATIDGEVVRVGDCVSVRPGEDHRLVASFPRKRIKKTGSHKKRRTRLTLLEEETSNEEDWWNSPDPHKMPDDIWFARVVMLFERKQTSEKVAHFRWFMHGGDTILEETAGPRELFLLDSCDENPLESISGKLRVDYISIDGVAELEMDFEKNHFFYRLWYDEEEARFEDAALHESIGKDYLARRQKRCQTCKALNARHLAQIPNMDISLDNDMEPFLQFQGCKYKVGDFVYIASEARYEIGQILKFEIRDCGTKVSLVDQEVNVTVRYFIRNDDLLLPNSNSVRDNRRLQRTAKISELSAEVLDGKCTVLQLEEIPNIDAFKDLEDTFYVEQFNGTETLDTLDTCSIPTSSISKVKFMEGMEVLQDFVQSGRKLRGMDIFAGAGGLTIGLDDAGAVVTEWAIEFSCAAVLSFKKNLPGVKVYNQDANVLLDRALKEANGVRVEDLIDYQGQKTPRMPKKGDVDFIYGGPPCQGFSGLNRWQKTNDIKNSLIATYLSYVDFYQPTYFLLENVIGLLQHTLGGKKVEDSNKVEGGIKMGTVKFILRALTSMGYQAQFSLVQAGDLGVPQSRRRVIFWGARLGERLPKYPEPTHVFLRKQAKTTITLPSGRKFTSNKRRGAPHSMTTIADAINDLPAFEYINPHGLYPAKPEQMEVEEQRAQTIPQYHVKPKANWVGNDKANYQSGARSEYQRWIRRGVPDDMIRNHYTRAWTAVVTERICTIPMIPGADHRSLPEKLKPWFLSHPDSASAKNKNFPGLFGRLRWEDTFQTALTQVAPNNKQGTVLHPTQHRIISVREHARSQGFPDWYVFASETDRALDMYRQIGNAVPIPMAYALGLELRKVIIEKWKKEKGFGGIDRR